MVDMSDSRRKREARLRRCLEAAPQVEAVIAEEEYAYIDDESADYDATDAVALKSPRPSGEATKKATKDRIGAPKVSLRSFFPETWLFTLDPVNEGSNLSR